MFHTIAPALASHGFKVLVPDLPGMGQSTHQGPMLTSKNAAAALSTVLNFFQLSGVHIFAYDKGCAPAILLARDHPDVIKSVIVSEYALPGFGHEIVQQPRKGVTVWDHWHLGLFTVPEAAVFLIRGREEQFLTWYFWHAAYSGLNSIKPEHFRRYVQEWQRPKGLESAIEFLGGSVWADMEDFRSVKISQELLVLGGEASLGAIPEMLAQMWTPVAERPIETRIVSKAGHWFGDENPVEVAQIVQKWVERKEGK
jgi:pimeloyl-ACP methyl ester carboxylesterase